MRNNKKRKIYLKQTKINDLVHLPRTRDEHFVLVKAEGKRPP